MLMTLVSRWTRADDYTRGAWMKMYEQNRRRELWEFLRCAVRAAFQGVWITDPQRWVASFRAFLFANKKQAHYLRLLDTSAGMEFAKTPMLRECRDPVLGRTVKEMPFTFGDGWASKLLGLGHEKQHHLDVVRGLPRVS